MNGQTMLTEILAELSGLPYAEFARRARETQEAHLARHKLGGLPPAPIPVSSAKEE